MEPEYEFLIRLFIFGFSLFIGYLIYLLAIQIINYYNTSSNCLKRWAEWYAIGNNFIPEYYINNVELNLQKNKFQKFLDIFKCWLGITCSYLIWGLVQERLMTKSYKIIDNNIEKFIKFKDSDFVIFVNRLFTLLIGFIILKIKNYLYNQNKYKEGKIAPFYLYGFSSISNLVSSICQYESLKYISFPTQVIIKSCKLVPVMFINSIISKKKYSKNQYIVAILLCCGFGLFLYGNSQTQNKDKNIIKNSLFWAISLSIGYLVFDSFTSTWQAKIFSDYKGVDSIMAMTYSSIISSFFSFGSIIANKQYCRIFILLSKSKEFRFHILCSGIASAVGQILIFYTIFLLGPITFTLIMVTRQIMSVLLSTIVYHHRFTIEGYIGMCLIFVVLICDRLLKYHKN